MQELALLLTGIAGAASAAAFTKFPKSSGKLKIIGANPRIQREIASMTIERDILAKTISRLYQQNAGIDETKRGKLLARYQHQLGIVLARIENLEIASKHPDMGPVGDGLVTLMDQKLSSLDEKLREISSKITISETKEKIKAARMPRKEIQTPKISSTNPAEIQQSDGSRQRVEITTLTPLATRSQFYEPPKPETVPVPKPSPQTIEPQVQSFLDTPKPEIPKPTEVIPQPAEILPPKIEPPKPKIVSDSTPGIRDIIPEPDEYLEDTAELDKLKKDIMKTLEKLDQVEVE